MSPYARTRITPLTYRGREGFRVQGFTGGGGFNASIFTGTRRSAERIAADLKSTGGARIDRLMTAGRSMRGT